LPDLAPAKAHKVRYLDAYGSPPFLGMLRVTPGSDELIIRFITGHLNPCKAEG